MQRTVENVNLLAHLRKENEIDILVRSPAPLPPSDPTKSRKEMSYPLDAYQIFDFKGVIAKILRTQELEPGCTVGSSFFGERPVGPWPEVA